MRKLLSLASLAALSVALTTGPATAGPIARAADECPPGTSNVDYCQTGGDQGDTQIGTDGDDVQTGGGGDDVQRGGGGNDTQNGGPGNDQQDGGSGNDTQFGGSGNDTRSAAAATTS